MELVETIEELSGLDPDLHWFCPRTTANDVTMYFDDDLTGRASTESQQERAVRKSKIEKAIQRKEKALAAAKIIAFDGEDAKPYQETLKHGLLRQLTRCDICIREFHRGRVWLRTHLEDNYPTDDVQKFMQTYDLMNNERIANGLHSATETLLDLAPDERNITASGEIGMFAMFEALHCRPFLRNEELLRSAFDQPFKLVQTKKKVNLPNCAPGMAAFLFSSNNDRFSWAERNLNRLKRPLLPSEFDYAVKPFLEYAAGRVNITQLEVEFLPTFWRAVRIIVSKLDQSLITNHLRAMDLNIYTLSLDHFQIDAPHFTDLIKCYEMLLQKGGYEFWDAMNPATPQNVVEQICKAPGLERLLTTKEEREHGQYGYIKKHLDWVDVLIPSIRGANLVAPLRTLLDLLLGKFQGEQYSHDGSAVAWAKGKSCLLDGIRSITKDVSGGPTYTHLIEAVSKDHLPAILKELRDMERKQVEGSAAKQEDDLEIIESILAMDIKGLSRDRSVIAKTQELDHEIGLSSLNAWKLCMSLVGANRPFVVAAILSGITGLLTLEKLPPKQIKVAPKPSESWNNALDRIQTLIVSELFERLDTFSPDQLCDLFSESDITKGVVFLLLNGDERIHQGALRILKTLSGVDGRRDSVKHLLEAFFTPCLSATSSALKSIGEREVFSPCHAVLKVCRDILDCLCDSRDGLLRSKTVSKADSVALHTLWNRLWYILQIMFEKTEPWSSLGYDKQDMQDFCRETMDFADYAFDQYYIIAGALETTDADDSAENAKDLLKQPNKAFKSTAKWLRLRDEYLIDKAVSLTTKMLDRLGAARIQISEESIHFIDQIVTAEGPLKVKTKLSMNQKALLQQTLERHLGIPLSEISDAETPARMKQSSLSGWAKSTSGQQSRSSGSSTPVSVANRPDALDMKAWSDAAGRQKAQEASQKKPMQKVPSLQQQKQAQMTQQKQANFLQQRKKQMAEQEKRRQAALARANQGAGSGVFGLGNYGNDMSNTGQTVMVDDDELDDDDEDDGDDLDDDLFGSSHKVSKIKRPDLNVSGTTGLKPEVKPTRISRTQRSMKDMRARLAPKLDDLHRTILGWDFFHEGDYPPGANEDEFREVSNSFRDPVTYKTTFEPLLMLEAWQGLLKAREEAASRPYEIKVSNRGNVDRLVEISSIIGHQENRDAQLMEGDIVLLSKSPKPADSADIPHCLARIYRVKRQKAHNEIVYQLLPNSQLAGQLTMQTLVWGLKVQSITPLEREFGSLQALQYYDLCNQIIRGKPSPKIHHNERHINQAQDVYNLNRAQAEAVNAALENEGFSLIQGPPGSGKTKTIVAIVGGLLTAVLGLLNKSTTRITVPKANGNLGSAAEATAPKKLLVCAPSNAAVDEIVMRLKEGVTTKTGAHHQINVVRLGRSDAINSQVQDVTIDTLVAKRTGGGEKEARVKSQNAEIFKQHESVSKELREMYDKRDAHEQNASVLKPDERKKLDEAITSARRHKAELSNRIDAVKDQERNAGREQELSRKRAQQAVLDEAHVICATLSGSGHDMFQHLNIEFETVVIDEAAQCVEMSSLIPLKYGCIKCVMVGDPKQLPPTVFSKEAARFQYEQSLFVRMQNNHPDDVHLLDTQYRMHPEISTFPSRTFYDGRLKDGAGMASSRKQPWHASALLAPYRFYDVQGQHQAASKGHSLINIAEIDVAMALYDRLLKDYKEYDFRSRIGIITPYKSQLRELKSRFSSKYGNDIVERIEFNTTDAFQGRESDIIIFSCVRASPAGGIGFLQDIRRMNVGLTRAKSSLWVLGNSESLARGQYWRKLVEDARARDAYSTGNLLSMLQKPSSAYPASQANPHSMLDRDDQALPTGTTMINRTTPVNSPKPPSAAAGPGHRQHSSAKLTSDAEKSTLGGVSEKMDGVRYRFEDRAKMPAGRQCEDVEMIDQNGDSDAAASREMAPFETHDRSAGASDDASVANEDHPHGLPPQTSTSGSDGPAKDKGRSHGPQNNNDVTSNESRSALLQHRSQAVRKRPAAASPFLPKKQKPHR